MSNIYFVYDQRVPAVASTLSRWSIFSSEFHHIPLTTSHNMVPRRTSVHSGLTLCAKHSRGIK
eukprot:scaffold250645_cov54-Attheya_sp.AAC.1